MNFEKIKKYLSRQMQIFEYILFALELNRKFFLSAITKWKSSNLGFDLNFFAAAFLKHPTF